MTGCGFALTVCIYCTAKVSGGHLNPAVSTGFVACGLPNFRFGSWVGYVVSQLCGSGLGAIFLYMALPDEMLESKHGLGAFSTLGQLSRYHPMAVFMGEFFCTFGLVFVIFGIVHSYNFGSVGPLIIGLTFSSCVFAIGPWTGAALSPARALAPMLIFGVGKYSWPYTCQVLGTLLGGWFAGKIFKRLFLAPEV